MTTDKELAKKWRASGPRSRGGCNTCKIRRVKCDEEKPGCRRCQKFGRPCDGYETKKTRDPPDPVTRTRNLLPIKSAQFMPSARTPITIAFQDSLQAQYFRLFYEETSHCCSGGWESPLWQYSIPQSCHTEPTILQCTVALAALDRSSRSRMLKEPCYMAEAHHRYALQQYGKALKGMRELSSRVGTSFRTVFLASVLIYCFENFHGDARLALDHVQSALGLMRDWLASKTLSGTSKGFSPAPNEVEDEVVVIYNRLDYTNVTWQNDRLHLRVFAEYAENRIPSNYMPRSFSNIVEASERWDDVLNRVFLYLGRAPDMLKAPKDIRDKLFDDDGIPRVNPPVLDEIYAWQAAFEPIFRRSRTPAGADDYVRATTMRIISITEAIVVQQVSYDRNKPHLLSKFLPEHCEIVALGHGLVQHPGFVKSFVFDPVFIPCLFFVVTMCRDRMLRREAILILKAARPRRESVWDSGFCAKMGEELLKLETGTIADVQDENFTKIWLKKRLQSWATEYESEKQEAQPWNNKCEIRSSPSPLVIATSNDMSLEESNYFDWLEGCMHALSIGKGEAKEGRKDHYPLGYGVTWDVASTSLSTV